MLGELRWLRIVLFSVGALVLLLDLVAGTAGGWLAHLGRKRVTP